MAKLGKDLSPKEREIAESLLLGMTNAEIGKKLGVGARTIDVHRGSIMSKTGAQSAVQLGFFLGKLGFGKPVVNADETD